MSTFNRYSHTIIIVIMKIQICCMIPLVIVVQHHILHQKVPVLHHMMLIPEQKVEAYPIVQIPNQVIVCVNSNTIGPIIIIETSL